MALPQLRPPSGGKGALVALAFVGGAAMLMTGLTMFPVLSAPNLFSSPATTEKSCQSSTVGGSQPTATTQAKASIPVNYLSIYQQTGRKYGIPWGVLAGIGTEETKNGQLNAAGVHSGQNGFGAAGPMQFGITGASGDSWGGPAIHPASENFGGFATDGNGDGIDNVYDPADAIPAAAKYLIAHGAPGDIQGAIFAYNHASWYVQDVLRYAAQYASGGYTLTAASSDNGATCVTMLIERAPNQAVVTAVDFARAQIGKPYVWGATGPDSFDCSGLVMQAYAAVGIALPRTSQQQFAWGPRVQPGQEQPGDLVFFAGTDGTPTSPGHVGLVIGGGMMIEAYAVGYPVRLISYRTNYPGGQPVGFSRPWAHAGVNLQNLAGQSGAQRGTLPGGQPGAQPGTQPGVPPPSGGALPPGVPVPGTVPTPGVLPHR